MWIKIYCWCGLGVYALLSIADFGLTSSLLRLNGGAYESNPVAAAALEQHGWTGLAAYKAAGVLAFMGSILLLIRYRPTLAAGIVTLGCIILLYVTTYSHGLILDTHREHRELGLTPEQIEELSTMPRERGPGPSDGFWLSLN